MIQPRDADDDKDEFYESLDRILSSSCSSTSASDDDAAEHRHHHARRRSLPRFPPPSAASYDVWVSDPAPVAERRRRLLQQMGLDADPTLARRRSDDDDDDRAVVSAPPKEVEIGRSVSDDVLCCRPAAAQAPIARSQSDGSVAPDRVHNDQPPHQRQPTPALVGEIRYQSDGGGDDDPRLCTIKNLDNGEEFVVRVAREDAASGNLREVGTGRQLTLDEFEMCVGSSPIVQELMRRQLDSSNSATGPRSSSADSGARSSAGPRSKKRGGWLKSIRTAVAAGGHHRDRRSSDERDTSSEKGGRRSSSATDDSQDGPHSHCPERIKVRHYGKSHKELTGLYLSQEIQAHSGAIWSIKFSPDGKFLASAGEDCAIHVWQVSEYERKEEFLLEREDNGSCNPFVTAISNGLPEPTMALACLEVNHWEKKRRAKIPGNRKSVSSDHLMVRQDMFALSEKPVRTFNGHLADVLDLSWSKSQYLLSSSMDKTVRLWHMSSNSCLKTFAHSDYVTCIQFNPVDDSYFISGSLDEKVRLWSIPDRQVVDWNDLHEMVTAVCYTPNGKGALVGSHKGSCCFYDTSDNKLQAKSQIDLQIKKKRSNHKKITGFQFAPGSSSEVLVTSADSRIRVVDGVELVHKFKGFRNTSSQISASLTLNGKYVICASEDSHVYMWRYDADSQPNRSKGVITVAQAYEHFHCQDVTVAIPWPNVDMERMLRSHSKKQNEQDSISLRNNEMPSEARRHERSPLPPYLCTGCSEHGSCVNGNTGHFCDRVSATWPEEKLLMSNKHGSQHNGELCNGGLPVQSRSAWGLVILTAGRGGKIKAFQNFGFPIRI